MQHLPEDLLAPPAPLVVLLSDAAYAESLAVALKTASSPAGGNASIAPVVAVNYVQRTGQFGVGAAKQRSHVQEYDSYAPAGLLKSNWLHKHHREVPAVVVSDILAAL